MASPWCAMPLAGHGSGGDGGGGGVVEGVDGLLKKMR